MVAVFPSKGLDTKQIETPEPTEAMALISQPGEVGVDLSTRYPNS